MIHQFPLSKLKKFLVITVPELSLDKASTVPEGSTETVSEDLLSLLLF